MNGDVRIPFLGLRSASSRWSSPSPGGTVPRSNSSAGEDAKEGRVDPYPRLEPLFSGALVRPRDEYWAIEASLARAFQAVLSFPSSPGLPLLLAPPPLPHRRRIATLFHPTASTRSRSRRRRPPHSRILSPYRGQVAPPAMADGSLLLLAPTRDFVSLFRVRGFDRPHCVERRLLAAERTRTARQMPKRMIRASHLLRFHDPSDRRERVAAGNYGLAEGACRMQKREKNWGAGKGRREAQSGKKRVWGFWND